MSSRPDKQADAVILDLGNVLVFHDNEELFRTFGECAGLRRDDVLRLIPAPLWNAVHRGDLDGEGVRREICRALGLHLTREEFDRAWNSHFTPNEAVLPLVESLIGRVKLLLLSNTNAIHIEYLINELPILRRFDHLVLSHEVRKMKPEAAIFEEALKHAGSAPARTAFFDDVPEYVQAARKVGIRSYLFTTAEAFAEQLAALGLR